MDSQLESTWRSPVRRSLAALVPLFVAVTPWPASAHGPFPCVDGFADTHACLDVDLAHAQVPGSCEAPLFADGFESGDTSAWSATATP